MCIDRYVARYDIGFSFPSYRSMTRAAIWKQRLCRAQQQPASGGNADRGGGDKVAERDGSSPFHEFLWHAEEGVDLSRGVEGT